MNTPTRRRGRRAALITAAGVTALIGLNAALHNSPSVTVAPAASGTATPSASPSQARYMDTQRISWQCRVTGDPASVTYGNDADEHTATGPVRVNMPGKAGAAYWYCQAQLDGTGAATAKVYELKTTRWSDGTTTRTRHAVATARASGSYAIANAEYVGLDAGVAHIGG